MQKNETVKTNPDNKKFQINKMASWQRNRIRIQMSKETNLNFLPKNFIFNICKIVFLDQIPQILINHLKTGSRRSSFTTWIRIPQILSRQMFPDPTNQHLSTVSGSHRSSFATTLIRIPQILIRHLDPNTTDPYMSPGSGSHRYSFFTWIQGSHRSSFTNWIWYPTDPHSSTLSGSHRSSFVSWTPEFY